MIDHTSSRISRSTHSLRSDSSTRVSSGDVIQISEYRALIRSSISPLLLRLCSMVMVTLACFAEVAQAAQRALRGLGAVDERLDGIADGLHASRRPPCRFGSSPWTRTMLLRISDRMSLIAS